MKAIVIDKKDPLFGSIVQILGRSAVKGHVDVKIIVSMSSNWNHGDTELFRVIHLLELKS
jgi:hypothetical protein